MSLSDDIRAALAKATPGPWEARVLGSEGYAIDGSVDPSAASLRSRMPRRVARCGYLDWDTDKANAHLIANAPTWLAELLAEVDEAQAEAMDVGHDYDRRGERLWRLAALAGWTPGNEADNDATAESYVRERLAEVDRLSHWKAEALPVIDGLQELGAELGIRLGGRITGPDALAAVKALTARAEAAEQAVQRVREFADETAAFASRAWDDISAHYTRTAAAGILRALDGGAS